MTLPMMILYRSDGEVSKKRFDRIKIVERTKHNEAFWGNKKYALNT